jgi:type II secretory pathway pseudopilin PulG
MSARSPRLARRARAGFTLVELLVAAGITTFMAGFIAVIVMNISANASRSSSRLGADAQARLILDQIEQDLQSALYRDDGNIWLAAEVLNGASGGATGLWQIAPRNPKPVGGISLALNTPSIADARYGTAGVWLRFFTNGKPVTVPDPATNQFNISTPSAPVAVGYQIIRRYTATNPANLETAYLLHRAEARPFLANSRPGVFESGYNVTGGAYTSGGTNNTNVTGDPRTVLVPGTARTLDAVIGDNVIDFGIRAYARDGAAPGGLRLLFPATAAGALSNAPAALQSRLPPGTPATASTYNRIFPDVIDVMVRILTDTGAEQIANLEKVQTPALAVPQRYNGNAQLWWWGLAAENSRVYTRRIVLRGGAL